MRVARWLLVVLVAGLVGLVVWMEASAPSPGPLAAVHARMPELAGKDGCARCHGGEHTTMAQACTVCHAEIAEQTATRKGLHGGIPAERAAACGDCHGEHNGADFPMVGPREFARIGVADVHAFDHAGLAYDLHGAHRGLACARCHAHAEVAILPPGGKRFLGASDDCATCHRDPHAGRLPDCDACHGQEEPFARAPGFVHDQRFPLVGVHAGIECSRCHDARSAQSVAGLLARGSSPMEVRNCASCHRDPHEGRLPACEACHGLEEPFARAPGFVHDARFPLAGVHSGLECKRCHDERGAQSVAGLLAQGTSPREVRGCQSCHASPHGAAFLAGVSSSIETRSEACVLCHALEPGSFRWPAARMDPAAHAASGFPLTGPHAEVKCERCHATLGTSAPADVPRFPGRSADDCAACHGDPHRGAFESGAFANSACIVCHDRGAFAPAAFGVELHARTRFPLTGAHLAVGCERCHSDAAATRDFRGASAACADCHTDVHTVELSQRPRPQVLEGWRDCARCHTTTSFASRTTASFDHEAWTGFPLRGAHRAAKCEACHVPQRATPASPRAFGVASRTCETCHRDPHAGQFASASGTDCAGCHRDDAPFRAIAFDHESQSRFHPGAVHAEVECSACHREYPRPGGGTVVRYKPLGTDCTDCHGKFTPLREEGRSPSRGGGG